MADNVVLNAGVGGATAAADDIGGIHHQRVKLSVGADGSASDAIPVSNGLDTSAAGVQAVGLTAQFDDVAVGTVTENQFAPVRMSSRRALLVEGVASGTVIPVSDGGGNLSIDDGGNSITVDGTVAVTAATLTTIAGAVAGTEMQVDVLTMPTVAVTQSGAWDEVGINDSGNSITIDGTVDVTGVSTAAKQDTIIGHVDGIEALLGTVNTAVQLIDDTVYEEDVAAQAADKGIAILAVRRDADTSLVGADNDYANLQVNAAGSLKVAITAGAGSGGTSIADGAGFTPDSTSLTVIGGYRDDTSPATMTEGDAGAARLTEYRALHVNLRDASGTELSVGGGTQYTEDAAAAANPVGNAINLIRVDTPATLVTTDGDNVALRGTNYGALYATLLDSSGNIIAGANQYTEDAAAAADPLGNAVILVRKDTPAATVSTDGDNIAQRGTNFGAGYVTILDSSGAEVSIGGGTQYDEDTNSASAQKLNMAGVTRADTAASQVGTDGDRSTLIVDSTGRLHVNVGNTVTVGSHAVTNAGTFVTQLDGTALNLLDSIEDVIVTLGGTSSYSENSSHGSIVAAVRRDADTSLVDTTGEFAPLQVDALGRLKVEVFSGEALSVTPTSGTTGPMKAEDAASAAGDQGIPAYGVRVDTPNAAPTGTDGDYSYIALNKLGSVRVAPLEDDLATAATKHVYKYYTNAGAVTDGIIWSPAAGTRWFLTSLTINVSAAATVTIEDDVAAGDVVRFKFEFAANSGITIPFPGVPMFSGEDAADLLVTTSAGNVYITAVGYEI